MSAYLFLWHPQKDLWSFRDFDKIVARIRSGKPYRIKWICPSKKPRRGDEALLQRTGPNHNGVFARGVVLSEPFENSDGKRVVDLEINSVLSIDHEIPRGEIVDAARFNGHWGPYASGNVIPGDILRAINRLWVLAEKRAGKPLVISHLVPARSTSNSKAIIRALSIQQPFAEQIMDGKKKYEYRSIPTHIRERVYVYASKKSGPDERWGKSGYERGSLPTGVLVGTVEVVGCEGDDGDYAWKLARPIRAKRLIKPKNQPQPVWFRPF